MPSCNSSSVKPSRASCASFGVIAGTILILASGKTHRSSALYSSIVVHVFNVVIFVYFVKQGNVFFSESTKHLCHFFS